jgi:hypothetical protein
VQILDADHGGRSLAFVFATARDPLGMSERIDGLRSLLRAFPGSLILGVDTLAGADAITHGGSAAIGVISSMRRPTRPVDPNGGPRAKGWLPGLFLPPLWETRSPQIYADSSTPTCADCGGRDMTTFAEHPSDKHRILDHNAHAWLGVHTEIRRRTQAAAREWLAQDRLRALEAHAQLQPRNGPIDADPVVLRALCELDDPHGWRTTPTGGWR